MRVDKARIVWEGNLRWGVVDSAFPERIDAEAGQYWYRYFVYHRREGQE
jgi:hypothetical protein